MAARASMTELITRIRGLIHDPAGTSTTFTDQEIQDALDTWRDEARYLELTPLETLAPTGIIYRDYAAERGLWEADEILVDAAYEPLTPATADRLTGRWTFDDHTPPPVYITGKTYDLHGAAADLLEQWAAAEKLSFDFGADGAQYRRSQKVEMLLQLAAQYRGRQRPRMIPQVRGDLAG